MEQERKRKPKFLDNEVDILVSKIQEKSDVLFTRFSDTVSNKKKKMAWVEVQNSINATSLVPRTLDEVMKNGMISKEVQRKGQLK